MTGYYDSDGGEIIGTLRGQVLEGYWIENASNRRCKAPKGEKQRYHWGRIRRVFDGDRCTGDWSCCEDPVGEAKRWKGSRE